MADFDELDLAVDVYAKTPAYQQLADKLRTAIQNGQLQPMAPVPSLRLLVERTGLAMATVQKAIRQLEGDNYLFTVSGRGTFVTPRNLQDGSTV